MPKIKAKRKTQAAAPAQPTEGANLPAPGDLPEAPGEPTTGLTEIVIPKIAPLPEPAPASTPEEIPERVELEVGRWINTVPVVGGTDMDVLRLDSGELVARRGGVAGTDEIPEIPEILVPFEGYVVPMSVSIRESNGLVGDRVAGVCKYQITMNGELVYAKNARTLRDALIYAGWTVQRLVEQMEQDGVRWWDERTWRHRRVMVGPVACFVADFDPASGAMRVVPDADRDSVFAVDILDSHLTWAPLEAPDGTA
jgi:hypothetical protein